MYIVYIPEYIYDRHVIRDKKLKCVGIGIYICIRQRDEQTVVGWKDHNKYLCNVSRVVVERGDY